MGTQRTCNTCGQEYTVPVRRDPYEFDQVKGNWGEIETAIVFTYNKVKGCAHSDDVRGAYEAFADLYGTHNTLLAIVHALEWMKEDADLTERAKVLYTDYKQTLGSFNAVMEYLDEEATKVLEREWTHPEGAPSYDATQAYTKPTKFYGTTAEEMGF